jgi:hypothetical protein
MKKISTLIALLFTITYSFSQTISYTTAASTYTQNFDGLPNTGGPFAGGSNGPLELNAAPFAFGLAGWYIQKTTGSLTDISLAFGTGSSNIGQVYSFGAAATTERALGSLASASKVPRMGALITNNTGITLDKFTITFDGEQWRHGTGNTPEVLTFSYKTGATAINDATGFTASASLNFTGLVSTPPVNVSLDGNAAGNRTAGITATITGLTWTNGQVLAIRWDDTDDGGSDDGLAIDNFQFSATSSTLPINCSAFGVSLQNNTANVNWQANCSDSKAYFEVEKSNDGTNFELLAKVNAVAAGDFSYNYSDNSVGTGNTYYRLKLVDVDGKYAYTKVERIKWNKGSFFINNIYPTNPVSTLHVQINSEKSLSATIAISDMKGGIVKQQLLSVTKGNIAYPIDVALLSTGTYILTVKTGETVISKRFIKE